jgi:hypothetical protein
MSRGKADVGKVGYALPQVLVFSGSESSQDTTIGRIERLGYTPSVWRPPILQSRLRWSNATIRADHRTSATQLCYPQGKELHKLLTTRA